LEDLFVHELRDAFGAEMQITQALSKALPKMIKATQSRKLGNALTHHLEETREHMERIREVFQRLGTKSHGVTCRGMQGLLAEGDDILSEEWTQSSPRDAAMLAGCQRVEHYAMAIYGTLVAFSKLLGHDDIPPHPAADAGGGEGCRRRPLRAGDDRDQRRSKGMRRDAPMAKRGPQSSVGQASFRSAASFPSCFRSQNPVYTPSAVGD